MRSWVGYLYVMRTLLAGITMFAIGCGTPDTPCDCRETITNLSNSLVERELELRKFDPENMDDYSDKVADYKQDLAEANEILLQCKIVYHNYGYCYKDGEGSLWDVGEGYWLPSSGDFSEAYTGDWKKDSTWRVERDLQINSGNAMDPVYHLRRDGSYEFLPRGSFHNSIVLPGMYGDSLIADSLPGWYREEIEGLKK